MKAHMSSNKAFGILAITLSLWSLTGASGQSTPYVQFGIKSGLSMSSLYGEDSRMLDFIMISDSLTPHARFGVPVGVSFGARLNAYWGLGVELFYTMKGKKFIYTLTRNGVTGNFDYLIKFNYLEAPVLIKFFIPGESDFNSNFYAGISPGFLGAATEQMKVEVEGKKFLDTSSSMYGLCNTMDYGLVFGYGGFVSEETIDVTLDLRCTMGLLNLFKREEGYQSEADIKNWQIMLLVGFVMRSSKNSHQ
jgi:hypothetical protein